MVRNIVSRILRVNTEERILPYESREILVADPGFFNRGFKISERVDLIK